MAQSFEAQWTWVAHPLRFWQTVGIPETNEQGF
jgi:hypothetical protein